VKRFDQLDGLMVHEELFRCHTAWKERIGLNCSESLATDEREIKKKWQGLLGQTIAKYVRLYPWFASF